MTDIEQYLHQTRQDIPDDGFTQRVMQNLPSRRINWDKIAQTVCYVIIAVILIFGGGINLLKEILVAGSSLSELFTTLLRNSVHILTFILLAIAALIYNCKDKLNF